MPLESAKIERLSEKLDGNIPEIAFAYLFGSLATGSTNSNSDIDIFEDQMAWMEKQLKYRDHEVQWSD